MVLEGIWPIEVTFTVYGQRHYEALWGMRRMI